MFNFVCSLIIDSGARFFASIFSVLYSLFGKHLVNFFANIFAKLWNIISSCIWFICKWILGMIDAMQMAMTKLMGLDVSSSNIEPLDYFVNGMKSISVSGTSFYDIILKIFKSVTIVAIVLMLIFTIVAMIMQEYKVASDGFAKADNNKGKFITGIFKNIITICLLPLIFYTIIAGTNAILTSFYRALGNWSDVTISGNVLATATYDANRYRSYANADKRIPITISVYDTENVFGKTLSDEELKENISNKETQNKLRAIAGAFANNNFLSFEKSTIYCNETWESYKNYSITSGNTVYDDLGQYFENFVCTREQYYVMADFIDFCQMYNVNYYIKSITESDICWKYVDCLSASSEVDADGNATGDIILNVEYRDAELVNSPENSANAASGASQTYSLSLSTKVDVTSPISDALKTVSTLLGIDESTAQYNAMERDTSGDYTNLVSWSTEKVFMKLSDGFNIQNTSTWTFSDEILMYEYYHFDTNNTFEDYTLDQLKNEGAKLPALEMTFRNFNSYTQTYSSENTQYCVKLNGSYYRVKKSETLFDEYGHAYYVLDVLDTSVKYFQTGAISIEKAGEVTIKLSSGFNINNNIDSWSLTDGLLVYEYFKDLSLSNGIRRTNNFLDFVDGVKFSYYKINGTSYYLYINGTYYQCSSTGSLSGSGKFLIEATSASKRFFGYKLQATDLDCYGISSLSSLYTSSCSGFGEIDYSDAFYQKYSAMNLKLSEDFSFYNSDSWTFRDYAIMYIYVNALKSSTTITPESLKTFGLTGTFGKSGSTYYLQIKISSSSNLYIRLENFSKTSEQKITTIISPDLFDELNLGVSGVELLSTYDEESDNDFLVNSTISYHSFYISEQFDAYDPKTWTIGDYYFIYLTRNKIIDTDIAVIQLYGYDAMCYVKDDENYYRFGKYKDTNAYFLSESSLPEGYDIDKWFNTNLLMYTLNYSDLEITDIGLSENDFAGGTLGESDSYIYDLTSSFSNQRSLQYILARDILDQDYVITNSSKLKYSYSNPSISATDLSTWNELDIVIYDLTGKLPTADNPYVSNLVDYNSNIFLIVEDKLVNISSSSDENPYYCNYNNTNQVLSKNNTAFSNRMFFNEYYNQNFKNACVTSLSDETSIGSFYYYSTVLKGNTEVPSFVSNQLYSDLDVVMIYNAINQKTTGIYTFDAYEKDGDIYIKLKTGCYLAISSSSAAKIYYKPNSLVSNRSGVFEKTDNTYTSFGTVYNKFDAVIYSLTGSTESKVYEIFQKTSDTTLKYINVNGEFIKYDNLLVGLLLDGVTPTFYSYIIETHKSDYIDFLYDEYYGKYVTTSAPAIVKTYTAQSISMTSPLVNSTSFKDWTPLALIFYENCLTLSDLTANKCSIISSTNDVYYLKCKSIYINLSDICDVQIKYSATSGNIDSIILNDKNVDDLKWKSYCTNYVSSEVKKINITYLSKSYTTDDSYFKNYDQSSPLHEEITSNYRAVASDPENVDQWTIIGLISLYIDPNNQFTSVKKFYYDGKTYYQFESTEKTYYLSASITNGGKTFKLWDPLTTSFTKTTISSSSVINGSPLKIVLNKNGWNNLSIYKYEALGIKVSGNNNTFYVFSNGSKNKVVYNIKDTISSENIIKYLTVNSSKVVGQNSDSSSAAYFKIDMRSLDDLENWNFFDLFYSYAEKTNVGGALASKVYTYGGKYYVLKDNKYIAVPLLIKSGTGPILTETFIGESEHNGKIVPETSSNITLKSVIFGSYMQQQATAVESGWINTYNTNHLTENKSSGKVQRIDFSENFILSDYSTWTFSDYILYYAYSNGFYKTGSFNMNFAFTYIPKYSAVGSLYYNLSYLDLVLIKAYGTTGSGTSLKYNYLDSDASSYDLALYYTGSSFYLKISDGKYAIISDDIYINFAKMEVLSNSVDAALEFDSESGVDQINSAINEINFDTNYYKSGSIGSASVYYSSYNTKNFQTFVNNNGAPARIYYLVEQNEETGSVEVNKVINFCSSDDYGKTGVYVNYDKFYEFYGKYIESYLSIVNFNSLDIGISQAAPTGYDLVLEMNYDKIHPDLVLDNYYYFQMDNEIFTNSKLKDVNKNIQSSINEGTTSYDQSSVNLKLSSGFDIAQKNTWTVLDFIILYEYSRDIRHNKFAGLSFEDLSTDFSTTVYVDDDNIYLPINGTIYNLKDVVEKQSADSEIYVAKTSMKISSTLNGQNLNGIVSNGTMNAYSFKIKYETRELSINPSYNGAVQYIRTKDNISYSVEESSKTIVYFREIDKNVEYTNYKIKVSSYANYTTQTIVKKVSWVEKLMTDMQVYYPDLNWGVLIATDGWLDTLGDFTSAYTTGLYVSDENSANTTAAGLVLAEFFMSNATAVTDSFADYEYSSVFDEDTIHSLMKSLMGESNYQALLLESQVFMEYFNSCYAPILDDFAEEFGEDIGSESLRICAYKSYLATLLLSSDVGEYLYTLATRVYAEYTICEYLANAAGDYESYYSYVNNLTDEEGNTIDAYKFGSFAELTQYENEYCGNANPTFSFNYNKAFDKYKDNDDKVAGYFNGESKNNISSYEKVVYTLVDYMNDDYSKIYSKGYTISESGKVIDKDNVVVGSYTGDTYIFCYMLHVYWSIRYEIGVNKTKLPEYLQNYEDYLFGKILRWSIISEQNIENADQYFLTYKSDKDKIAIYRNLSLATLCRLYSKSVVISGIEEEDSIIENIGSLIESIANSDSLMNITNQMISKNNAALADLNFIKNNSKSLYSRMLYSEGSSSSLISIIQELLKTDLPGDTSAEISWNVILELEDHLESLIKELQEIRKILPGGKTENGSQRKSYTDEQVDEIITAFQNFKYNISQYIAAQTRSDKLKKESIVFTLGQFGANYVSSGYTFSVKNKTYTFRSSMDASRIAEYVYGGSFLESVGVGARYTTAEFDGIVKASKIYDEKDKIIKTELNAWSELRGFASKLADETAELYFLTNLADLDISKVNAVKLTDQLSGGTTIESLLINYLESSVPSRVYQGATTNHDKFIAIAKYLFSYDVEDDELEDITFEDFKRIAMQKVIDNDQNEEETAEERANRYLALFNILGLQINFTVGDKSVERIIPSANITDGGVGSALQYKNNVVTYSSNVNSGNIVENYALIQGSLSGSLRLSNNTLEVIKTLSDLENRPTEEILVKQYTGNKPTEYYDEADGDSFIICTYKDGLYYPIIATGEKTCSSAKYTQYLGTDILKKQFISNYYDDGAYVVVAKGIITADGYPTAIRKYNNPISINEKSLFKTTTKEYNAVTFYRTTIGANFGSGDDLVNSSKAISKVSTKNYTQYVSGTAFSNGIGSSVTYTGRTNLKTFVTFDYDTTFIQQNGEYLISQADDVGAISVLDEFSYFYLFGGQSWALLLLAFITIIPILINAIGGLASRIFDMIILFIISPLIISTRSLNADGKSVGFDKWKKSIETNLFCVFGYIIGFSAFFIVVPIVQNMTTFVSLDTYNSVIAIGGIGKYFSYNTINSLLRGLWMITAVSIVGSVPKMILPIITTNRGDMKSPDPSLNGDGGKPFTDKATEFANDVKKIAMKVGSVASGSAFFGLAQTLKDEALSLVPGSAFKNAEKKKTAKKEKTEKETKEIQSLLSSYGYDNNTVKKIGDGINKANDEKEKKKEQHKKEFEKDKQNFKNLFN